MAKSRINQLPQMVRQAAAGDKLPIWDEQAQKTKFIDVTKLPFAADEEGVDITILGSPFPVRYNYSNYSYDEATGNSTITDMRLLGKDDYAVSTTQFGGGEFRDEVLEYNPVAGSVTILGFKLDEGEKIRVYADGVQGASAAQTYKAIENRLNLLEAMMAPFTPTANGANGAKVLWNRPAVEIPPGWQEWVDMRGRMPLAVDPNDNDFKTINAPGGAKKTSIVLEKDNLPEITLEQGRDQKGGKGGYDVVSTEVPGPGGHGTIKYELGGTSKPIESSIMNPYRIVMWIEFVGLN